MKKLVYTLGTIAAVATPLVAVVSCGSNKGNGTSLPTLEKGEYPNQDWFDKVSNSEIQTGEKLIANGKDLGYRYQVITKDADISTATNFTNANTAAKLTKIIDDAFKFDGPVGQEFKAALEKSFQFFYIQIINPETHTMSATKTIYLPHLSSNISDADKDVYKKLITAESISSNSKDIPVTAYDAPSVMNMDVSVNPTNTHVARIYTNGQRYPQRDAEGHLSDVVVNKFLTSTLKADSVSGPANGILGDYETEFHTSFTNELYLSQITSALHVYRDNLPAWLLRTASMVGDNAENGFTVPFGHLPQNPMDFDRMLSSLSTSLKAVKFVQADTKASLDFQTLGNGKEVYTLSKTFGNVDLPTTGAITLDMAKDVAKNLIENKYIDFERQYAPFEAALNINSDKNIADQTEMFKGKLTTDADYQKIFVDGEYSIKAKNDVYAGSQKYFAGQYVPIKVAKTVWNWQDNFFVEDASSITSAAQPSDPSASAPAGLPATSTFTEDQTTLYRAYLQIATKWWTDGSAANKAEDMPFSELTEAVKVDQSTATTRQFALKELFEWSTKDQLTKRASLWCYDDTNKRVNFQITREDTIETLANKLVGYKLVKATEIVI